MLSLQSLSSFSKSLGFDLLSWIPYTQRDPQHLELWLNEARHACLDYMAEHPRHDPSILMEHARSMILLTTSYNHPSSHAYSHLRIARYAHHLDYHEVLRERLETLATFIAAETGAQLAWRCATDSAPLLERTFAQHAGLGWIGKNSLLIHPSLGSFTLIAELLLDIDPITHTTPTPTPNRCGSCSKCLHACPTQALASPYVLDARRCISTWTIESSGPIPRWIRPLIGDMIFGCDICQEVCPWNSKSLLSSDPKLLPSQHPTLSLSPLDILTLTSRQFNQIFAQSPVLRAGRHGLARNAAVVLGNSKNTSCIDTLLQRCSLEHSPLVRGHIAWALSQFDASPSIIHTLQQLMHNDPSSFVQLEAQLTLEHLGHLAFSFDPMYP